MVVITEPGLRRRAFNLAEQQLYPATNQSLPFQNDVRKVGRGSYETYLSLLRADPSSPTCYGPYECPKGSGLKSSPANGDLLNGRRAPLHRRSVDSSCGAAELVSPLHNQSSQHRHQNGWRISQVIYELKAVGEQTRDLLDSTTHVETSLQAVRTLRRQKSSHLDVTEKKWIDGVLINTEKTLGNVAMLIEPARVDMQTKFGRVGFVNRGLFVFRDSPKVGTNLSRLNLAGQSLNTAMNILCTREGRAVTSTVEKNALHSADIPIQTRREVLPPPTYVESEFLNRRRHTHLSNRTVTRCSSTLSLGNLEEKPATPVVVANSIEEEKAAEAIDKLTLQDEVTPVASVITVQEVNATPIEAPQNPSLDEADSLQVCEPTYFQTPINKDYDFADGLQICDAEYATSPHSLSFEGADGLEVCEGKNPSSPYTQGSQFNEPDGLQVCNAWNAPIPVHQDPPVESSQNQSGHHQQKQTNQWHEQRLSYQQLPYPLSENERSLAGPRHHPQLPNQLWPYHYTGDHYQRISQPQNPPYPNPPYPNLPYQNTSNQNPSYRDPLCENPPYQNPPHQILPHQVPLHPDPPYTIPTLQHQPPYPHNQNQDLQWKQLPPVPRRPLPLSDEKQRPASISTRATNDRTLSQHPSTTIARKPVSKPPDAHALPQSPPLTTSPTQELRRASRASTSSWTPSELSQVSSTSTSTRKSRGRAWLEFQAER